MEKILKLALKSAEQAEILCYRTKGQPLSYYNMRATDVLSRNLEEVSLRVIRNGRIGTSRGSLSDDPAGIVKGALKAAEFGPSVSFVFPKEKSTGKAKIFDKKLADLTVEEMARDAEKVGKLVLRRAPEINMNIFMDREIREVSILNSSGKDESYKITVYTVCLMHMFERSKEGINKELVSCKYFKCPEAKVEELLEEYNYTKKPVSVPKKQMPVIFRTSATWSLLYRVLVGTSGDSYARDISPLKQKIGQKIFPEFVTFVDDPTRPWCSGSVPFDDEGTPTGKKFIVEKGVMKNFVFDLDSAARAGMKPTGNGFKRSMWSQGIDISPNPRCTNFVMSAGDWDYRDMISDMSEGIIINDVIGFHSGNMVQGEFSMNVGMGAYIKKGKILGRAVDAMVAGNIYQDFNNLKGLGKDVEYNAWAYSPDMYFSKMNVSGTA
jgi:PmbA protein